MSDYLNMEVLCLCGDQLKKFEEDYLKPMIEIRDKLFPGEEGEFKNASDKKKFIELQNKCIFLQNFANTIKETISVAGVSGYAGENFVKAMASEKEIPAAGFYTFSTTQSEKIVKSINSFRKLFGYISGNNDE